MKVFHGMGGHHSARAGKDEWLTPPELLRALGSFDLDPCAPVERPWATARHHFTVQDNGLLQAWFGRVWLNPPYGNQTGRWLGRLVAHGIGTALIFARTETDHFFRFVWDRADAVLFLRGRLNFHHVDGARAEKNSGAPSVLIAYGHRDAEILGDCGLPGQFIPLTLPRQIAVLAVAGMPSWRDLVAEVMASAGPVRLDTLYRLVSSHPKTRNNRHWREKVRQVLQQGPFRRVDTGIWEAA